MISVENNVAISYVKKCIEDQLSLMNNKHDDYLVVIEAGTNTDRQYGVFKTNGKELSLDSFPGSRDFRLRLT